MSTVPMPDETNLKPNSHKYHEEHSKKDKPKAEKVVEGKATAKKKSTRKQFQEAIIGDVEEVRSYLLWDVLIPAIKDTMVDLIKAFAEGLFHSTGNRNNSYVQRSGPTSYVSYSSYGNQPVRYSQRPMPTNRGRYNAGAAHDMRTIFYDRREDAENVLNAMVSRTFEYGMTSVADFYELSGIPSTYVDVEYGWTELSSAYISHERDGYIINLPKVERLD